MLKADLIDAVAEKTGLTKVSINKAIDGIFAVIGDMMVTQDSIGIPEFGVFQGKPIKAGNKRNPQTGEMFLVPAHTAPHFRAYGALKSRVR